MDMKMAMKQVSDSCFAVLCEKNRVCDANSGLINREVTFERLGTLRCRFAEPTGRLLPSRWPVREPLKRYHQQSATS